MPEKLIKEDAILTIILNAEEAEKFIVAFYAIQKMRQDGATNLPEWMEDGLAIVYDKIADHINKHNLGI